jgi:hypothetical protein
VRANRGKGTVGEWDAERRTQKLSSVSLAVVVLDRLNSFISFLHFHSTTQRHEVVCRVWVLGGVDTVQTLRMCVLGGW